MTEGAQCHCTLMTPIYVIVGHSSPDFEGVNYSMRRLQISNKNKSRRLSGNPGYGPEWLILPLGRSWCIMNTTLGYDSRYTSSINLSRAETISTPRATNLENLGTTRCHGANYHPTAGTATARQAQAQASTWPPRR